MVQKKSVIMKQPIFQTDKANKLSQIILCQMAAIKNAFIEQLTDRGGVKATQRYTQWYNQRRSTIKANDDGSDQLKSFSKLVVYQFAFLTSLKMASILDLLNSMVSAVFESLQYEEIVPIFSFFKETFIDILTKFQGKISPWYFYQYFSALGFQYLSVQDYERLRGEAGSLFIPLNSIEDSSLSEFFQSSESEVEKIKQEAAKCLVAILRLNHDKLSEYKVNIFYLLCDVGSSSEVEVLLSLYSRAIIGVLLRCYSPYLDAVPDIKFNPESSLLENLNKLLSTFLQQFSLYAQVRERLFISLADTLTALREALRDTDYGSALVELVALVLQCFGRRHLTVDAFLNVVGQYPVLAQPSDDRHDLMVESARDQSPTSIMLSEEEVKMLRPIIDAGY